MRKLVIPRRGWCTRQMVLNTFSMVSSISSAVISRKAMPTQVSWRACTVNRRRYSSMALPVVGTKLRKMKLWISSPMFWNAGTAESMAKVTVIIGTTANSVV